MGRDLSTTSPPIPQSRFIRALPFPASPLNLHLLTSHFRPSLSPNSHGIISFADPHPPTPFGIISFQKQCVEGILPTFPRCDETCGHSLLSLPRYLVISLRPYFLFSKSFSCNTYGSPRKCCKQKTYDPAKPFRCNTYKIQGEGAVGSDLPLYRSTFTCRLSTSSAPLFHGSRDTDHDRRFSARSILWVAL